MARNNPRYLVDESGRKISVVLAISEYRKLLEDLQDLALIAERKNEPAESISEVKKRTSIMPGSYLATISKPVRPKWTILRQAQDERE